jgi:hypothetical protein
MEDEGGGRTPDEHPEEGKLDEKERRQDIPQSFPFRFQVFPRCASPNSIAFGSGKQKKWQEGVFWMRKTPPIAILESAIME